MMKRYLILFTLSACTQTTPDVAPPRAPLPESSAQASAPTKLHPTVSSSGAAPKAAFSAPVLAWGDFGKEVASGAKVLLHSRISLKEQPAEAAPIIESCLPKDPCPDVSLRYEVENADTKTLQVWHAGFWPNHRVLIMKEDGTEAALTKQGEERKAAFSPRGARDKNVEWPIKAKAIDESEGPISLFALSPIFSAPPQPGRYLVRVDYEEEVSFSSNTLTLWVVRPGAKKLIEDLNGWYKDECDALERPGAHPDFKPSGESRGFIESRKEELGKLGVSVLWDATTQRYYVASSR